MEIFNQLNLKNNIFTKSHSPHVQVNPFQNIHFGNSLDTDVFERSGDEQCTNKIADNSIQWNISADINEIDKLSPGAKEESNEEKIHIEQYAKRQNKTIIDDELLIEYFIRKYSWPSGTDIVKERWNDRLFMNVIIFYKPIFAPTGFSCGDIYPLLEIFTDNAERKKRCQNNYTSLLNFYTFLRHNTPKEKVRPLLDNIKHYPDTFLESFLRYYSKDNEEQCIEKFNNYCSFMKDIKVWNDKLFSEKCNHLKADFSFETPSDMLDALDSLMESYPDKLEQLKKINKFTKWDEKQIKEFYSANMELVDYIYKNSDENKKLSKLEDILSYMPELDMKKFKDKAHTYYKKEPKEKITISEMIDFSQDLKKNNITFEDFNIITKNSIINSVDITDKIQNFREDIAEIIALKELKNYEDGKELYLKYPNCIRAILKNSNLDSDILKQFFELVEKFNINSGKELLAFYNEVKGNTGKNKKKENTIKANSLYRFIELFQYATHENLKLQAQKENTTINQLLKKDKNTFDEWADEIRKFILEDENNLYTGMSELAVYKKYKNEISAYLSTSHDIQTALFSVGQNLSPEEHDKRIGKIDAFKEYIPDIKKLNQFIRKNKISFDDDAVEEKYRDCCLRILELISNDKNIQNKEDYINYFSNSEFLAQSKLLLSEFLNSQKSDERKQKFLRLVVDKKIPSLSDFRTFMRYFADSEGNYNNVIEHLSKTPESMDFSSYQEALKNLHKNLKHYSCDSKLNNSNILKLDDFNKSNICFKHAAKLRGAQPGFNVITTFNNAFITKYPGIMYTPLSRELLNSYGNNNPQNSIDLLKLLYPNHNSYIIDMPEHMPEKFVKFLNDDEYKKIEINGKEKIANISIHALLRLISRYILQPGDDIEKLYTPESKEKLHNIIKSLYSDTILNLYYSRQTDAFVSHIQKDMYAFFAPNGRLKTVHP